MTATAPRYTTAQLVSALGIERRHFHALRAAGTPALRIPPAAGRSTRDVRWSLFDAARFAVLASLAPARRRAPLQLPTRCRRAVFECLDEATLRAAARGEPVWLLLPLDGPDLVPRVSRGARPDPGENRLVALADVTALAGRAMLRLRLQAGAR